jgi:hypothetical protein
MGEPGLEVAQTSPSPSVLSLGRWADASVRVDETGVLPVEAVLVAAATGGWELVSLRPGGTVVNGRPTPRCAVVTGDVVEVGGRRVVLQLPEPPTPMDAAESPLRTSLRWGASTLDERVFAPEGPVTLGPEGSCRLETLARTHVAARVVDGRWAVAVDGPWRAVELVSGRPLVAEASSAGTSQGAFAPLPHRGARLELGGLSLTLVRAPVLVPERVEHAPWWSSAEGQRTLISLLVAVFLMAVLRNPPVGGFAPDEAAEAARALVAQYRPPPRVTPEVKLESWRRAKADEKDEAGTSKAVGREGVSGRPNATRTGTRRAGPKTDAELVREHALLKALSSGVAERLLTGGTLSAASAVGRLDGEVVGDAAGTLGLGLRGDGRGGGGLSNSTVGVAAVGTGKGLAKAAVAGRIGHGGGSDLGLEEPANVAGGLDREVIRRVVVSHRAQVRYCYEKQLTASPGIAGKLLVEFVISADGHVVSARPSEDDLGDPEVGRCIVSRVRGWTFPPPKGGGVVVVTYPFLFKPAARGNE